MTELDQLKADLAAFKRVRECSGRYGYIHEPDTIHCIAKIEAKIKVLEAPPDPFREAKRTIARQRGGERYNSNQVDYSIHLEDEVERLKAELESRPVVWCLKTSSGSLHTGGVNNTTILFHSMTDALSYAAKHGYNWLKADTYTGKESV